MKHILVTGATGTIGLSLLHYLLESQTPVRIIAGVRNKDSLKNYLQKYPNLGYRKFDFEKPNGWETAFDGIDVLFLLRPPHISKVQEVFRPILSKAWESGLRKIVFLSVQGVEKSKVIPHHKIENLIQEIGFQYVFVRPSYFMQNLTTNLLQEVLRERTISLPSKNAKFNWIDAKNIGEVTALFVLHFEKYRNQAFEITGTENKSFGEVTSIMSEVIGEKIVFKPMSPIGFYLKKKREGLDKGFAFVMTLLHFLPRFQEDPKVSNTYQIITNKTPTTIRAFLEREKDVFSTSATQLESEDLINDI